MTVLFSLAIIICGYFSYLFFNTGSKGVGILFGVIVVLSIIALIGRILAERGIFLLGFLFKKKSKKNGEQSPNQMGNASVPVSYNPNNSEEKTVIQQETSTVQSEANQIREIKKLLDDGLISEEEYETKKKKILGI